MRFLIFFIGFVLMAGTAMEAQTVKSSVGGDQPQSGSVSETKTVTDMSGNSFLTGQTSGTAELAEADNVMPPSERLARSLWNATTQTSVFAKEVGNSIVDYVKEKQSEKEQQELVDRFYLNCRQLMMPLRLMPQDYAELMRRVELVYIEDGEKKTYRLDTRTFRDLPNIIKKEHADMMLERIKDGEVRTYHPNGVVKTAWHLQGGKPEGSVITYYENGEILYIDVYKNGQKMIRRKYDKEGRLEFEQPYHYTEEPPKSAESITTTLAVAKPDKADVVSVKVSGDQGPMLARKEKIDIR